LHNGDHDGAFADSATAFKASMRLDPATLREALLDLECDATGKFAMMEISPAAEGNVRYYKYQ